MKNIEKHLHHLHLIGQCKPKIRKLILKNADKNFIKAICECIYNFINGNVVANDATVNKLKKHKKTIRKILTSKGVKNKKEILIQNGGFLPLLIPTILQVVTSLINDIR